MTTAAIRWIHKISNPREEWDGPYTFDGDRADLGSIWQWVRRRYGKDGTPRKRSKLSAPPRFDKGGDAIFFVEGTNHALIVRFH